MGALERYRYFAEECVLMARVAKEPQNRAALLQMAQVWFRLAQENARDTPEKIEN